MGSVLVGRHSSREDMTLWPQYYYVSGSDVAELGTFCTRLKFVDMATVLDSPRKCCSCFKLRVGKDGVYKLAFSRLERPRSCGNAVNRTNLDAGKRPSFGSMSRTILNNY